jgi:hypothetical protein
MFADGFSIFDSKGEYELVDRSMCPVCMRRPFTKATIYLEKIRFLGSLIGDISYNVGSEIIVNNRFIQKWREDDLRGLAFSQDPIQASLKRKSTFSNPDKQFFLALPEARITQFTDEAEVVYPEKPRCRICSSQYVSEIARLSFPPDAIDDTDCCLVSCLPGWLVVSYRFLTFIEEHRLMNITFMEGFQQYEDQTLIRKGYWWQHRDGHLERFPECTEADMEALRQRWPQS